MSRREDKVCPVVRCGIALVTLVLTLAIFDTTHAAEKVRFYPCGEDDPDAEIGAEVLETEDIMTPPDTDADGNFVEDSQGEYVLLTASGGPVYVEGREGPDSFAIEFDGEDDKLTSPPFDPRNFSTFASLSQAWVKPDSGREGEQQYIWSLGNDNGGVGISPDGNWELIASSSIPDTVSDTPVEFDEWTHVAVFRGGNGATLFINGQAVLSRDNFWNGVGDVTVGNRTSGGTDLTFFAGVVDDFNIAGFPDFDFTEAEDIDFSEPDAFSGVPGDVDQNGTVDAGDYAVWSENVGFDNGLGTGDGSTLLRGDVDGNGRIDYFDFQFIFDEANLEPAGEECDPRSGVVVADDFFYNQPTKELGPGGGFLRQDYAGGQNGPTGAWAGQWVSVGNGIITGPDFETVEQQFLALTTAGLSANFLQRNFSYRCVESEQTIYFGVQVMTPEEGTPVARFYLNSPDPEDEEFEVSIGFDPNLGIDAKLGFALEFPLDVMVITPGEFHQLVGRLDINAAGNDELLTVWLDPDDVESGEIELEVEADIVTEVAELDGALRLDRGTQGGGMILWDDVAVGTTWESVTEVDIERMSVVIDEASGNVRLVNSTGVDVELNFYQLSSESGSLDPAGWNSLADQPGDLWKENSASDTLLTESSFSTEATTIAPGGAVSLGAAFRPGATNDVVARVGTRQGLFNLAPVTEGSVPVFRRGDSNGDCTVDITDAVFTLTNLFSGGPSPVCPDAADVDDDGTIVLTDAVNLLEHLFSTGAAPPAPGIEVAGPDPTDDDLPACVTPACEAG